VPRASGTLRRGPAAAGAGAAMRGSRRARRATARKGASEAAAQATARPPGPWPLTTGSPAALLPTSARARPRAWAWPPGLARRRCALEAVEKVVTAHRGPTKRPATIRFMHTFTVTVASFFGATHPSSPKSTGLNWWQAIVAIGVVLGIMVGLGTFIDWGGRIRNRRINKTVDELVRSKLKADDIEGRLAELTQLNDSLRNQIGRVPDEANRLFLESRLEQLATGIARDFEEYLSVQRQLETAGSATVLDPRIRDAIESTILPPQRRRDRRIVYILVLLAAALALNLSPLNPNVFVYHYFSILSDSPDWTSDSPVWAITIGGLAIALILLFVSELSTRFQSVVNVLRRWPWIAGLCTLIAVSIALGYWMRDVIVAQQCFPITCSATDSGSWFTGAGIAFNAAPIIGGFLLAALISRPWRKRRIPPA